MAGGSRREERILNVLLVGKLCTVVKSRERKRNRSAIAV